VSYTADGVRLKIMYFIFKNSAQHNSDQLNGKYLLYFIFAALNAAGDEQC